MDRNSITATVYHINSSGVYYLKVEMFGMYISDITGRKSKFSNDEPWIQMPSYQRGSGYKKVIEFYPGSHLKAWIDEACINAVKECRSTKQLTNVTDFIVEDLVSDEELKKELDALPY